MRPRDLLDMLLLGAIWGGSFPLLRVASPQFGPIALIAVRVAVAAVLLAVLLRSFEQVRANPGKLFFLGLLNTAIPFVLFSFATLYVTAGMGALLNATVPAFGALFAYLLLGERISALRVAGIVMAFGGIATLVWGAVGVQGGYAALGASAGLLAAAMYAGAAIYAKRQLAHIDSGAVALGSVGGATLALIPAGALSWPTHSVPPSAWLAAVALGALCTAIAYLIHYRLLSRVGAARTVTVTFLIPVFGILWGALFLGERITSRLVFGCVVVLIGTALALGLIEPKSNRPA